MSIDLIKQVREQTGLSLGDIKKAVDNFKLTTVEEVIEHLRKQGVLKKGSRSDRITQNGKIFGYVHEGRIGILLEIKCETDFVARSDAFTMLGQDIALHIAAYKPLYISVDQAPQDYIKKELDIARSQLETEGKPAEMIEKILKGKEAKILEENALLNQSFLKNPDISVDQKLQETSQATGEKLEITRFSILELT